MGTLVTADNRWTRGVQMGEYVYQDLVSILFFYSKQVIGTNIDLKGAPQERVIAELNRMDEIVLSNKAATSQSN